MRLHSVVMKTFNIWTKLSLYNLQVPKRFYWFFSARIKILQWNFVMVAFLHNAEVGYIIGLHVGPITNSVMNSKPAVCKEYLMLIISSCFIIYVFQTNSRKFLLAIRSYGRLTLVAFKLSRQLIWTRPANLTVCLDSG